MTGLDGWLQKATRKLSKDSAAQVRTEIREHYESARDAAVNAGAGGEEADRQALAALGGASVANRQYRAVLLTSSEARMLHQGNSEARALSCGSWLSWRPVLFSTAALGGAGAFWFAGDGGTALMLLCGGAMGGFVSAARWLPVYTPARGLIFRCVKWALLIGVFALAFSSHPLMLVILWPLIWVEWKRASIRRKLPVSRWPKQLYF